MKILHLFLEIVGGTAILYIFYTTRKRNDKNKFTGI